MSLGAVGASKWQRRDWPPEGGIGRIVAHNLSLRSVEGKRVTLGEYAAKKALVLVFMGTQCPVGNLYAQRLSALDRKFRPRGVAILGINANASETAEQVAQYGREYALSFPILKDDGNQVADLLLAGRTCEVVVLDEQRAIRYRGAIDDEYLQGGGSKRVGVRPYLAEALEAVLAGRRVWEPVTSVQGCPIERATNAQPDGVPRRIRKPASGVIALREAARDDVESTANLEYARDVEPIIASRCRSCHRPGQVGPFSLLTIADARRWATAIAEVVEDDRMPPWHADPRYGHFANDRSLTAHERGVLIAWGEQAEASADAEPASTPATSVASPAADWSIGQPDLIFTMPEPFAVPAQGVVAYQHFTVPTHFSEDVWVQAAEIRPSDRSVVHHIIVRVDEKNGKLPYFVGYTPGDRALRYTSGIAKRIPAGSDLRLEVHYQTTGRPCTDQSSVGLILARHPIYREAITYGIANDRLVIPPGAAHHPIASRHEFKSPAYLLSLSPHMHLRGKDFRYTAVYPDGTSEILLWVPAYDFGWQSIYVLATPKLLPSGVRIDCLAHFDNSSANPNNPDPTRTVTFGPQSDSEMMVGFAEVCVDLPRVVDVDPSMIARVAGPRTAD